MSLRRDSANEVDPNAMLAFVGNSPVGFVEADVAAFFSPLVDANLVAIGAEMKRPQVLAGAHNASCDLEMILGLAVVHEGAFEAVAAQLSELDPVSWPRETTSSSQGTQRSGSLAPASVESSDGDGSSSSSDGDGDGDGDGNDSNG